MSQKGRPIGVFDSGVGGLTVMRAVVEALPGEDIIYLGDTARVPYGNRGAETVRRYVLNAAETLLAYDIKALVVACNTATAYGLEALRAQYPELPVVGVVEPVARRAAQVTRSGKIGVLGTRGTVLSGSYPQTLRAFHPGAEVHQVACPLLVPLAEEGWSSGAVTETVVESYVRQLAACAVDTLILGCTHYPLLEASIRVVVDRVLGEEVRLLDSGAATAEALRELLVTRRLLRVDSEAQAGGKQRFLLTDIPDGFVETAMRFFGSDILSCEHVDIVDGGAMTRKMVL